MLMKDAKGSPQNRWYKMNEKYDKKELDEMLKEQACNLPDDLDSEVMTKRKISYSNIKLIDRDEKYKDSNEDSITNGEIPIKKEKKRKAVPTTSLIRWFGKYQKSLPKNIETVNFRVVGVESDGYLFITVPNIKGGFTKNGEPKRDIIMFRNADRIPVIDLPVSKISIYQSGFRMIHPFKGGFFKCYGGKPNNLVVSMTNDTLIPYYMDQIKNSSNALIFKENSVNYKKKLDEAIDRSSIQVLYKVVTETKEWSSMNKNIDLCKYFLKIQENIRDNPHHIKIDNIMIGMMTGPGKFPTSKHSATHVKCQFVIDQLPLS